MRPEEQLDVFPDHDMNRDVCYTPPHYAQAFLIPQFVVLFFSLSPATGFHHVDLVEA